MNNPRVQANAAWALCPCIENASVSFSQLNISITFLIFSEVHLNVDDLNWKKIAIYDLEYLGGGALDTH